LNNKSLASIISVGISKFGNREGLSGRELLVEAAIEAFEGCPALNPKRDIKALVIGQMAESFEHQGHIGPISSDWLGILPAPATRTEVACASSSAAIRYGVLQIMSGLYDIVMVGGFEKMTGRTTLDATEYLSMAADFPLEQWNGITFPGLFALMARAHMHKYGTTEEQMAMIAVKNHHNAMLNPKAHMQKEITIEKAIDSRPVANPLKLYDCSLISDGAACAILTRPDIASNYTDSPVHIIGSGHSSDTIALHERDSLTSMRSTRLAAKEALVMAGIEAKDVDIAELHDCFTIAELIAYEDLGFCGSGKGGKLIQDGETALEGSIPVNTSGGLKAKGHPVGATGVAQLCEIFYQLTDYAGDRQVHGCKIGLSHNLGGSGATCIVHVYRRN
jgi:acetyl-CoA C-acetyltransferase